MIFSQPAAANVDSRVKNSLFSVFRLEETPLAGLGSSFETAFSGFRTNFAHRHGSGLQELN
jgi:hypothetical protein